MAPPPPPPCRKAASRHAGRTDPPFRSEYRKVPIAVLTPPAGGEPEQINDSPVIAERHVPRRFLPRHGCALRSAQP